MGDIRDFEAQLSGALGNAYVVERELLGSGMSRVFVATERALNRRVVVKVLPPELAAGVNRERFQREIQLAAQLQHPHIVPLLAAGADGELLYFTMPFIEGESLRHAIHDGVRFSPRDVIRILHDVTDALAYAHARGVIHRDIKPGNVLRSGTHAMVTDFGVAKAISAALPSVGMTTSGMAIGTPQYMAPEQLAGDPAADHRVDIYAVGLLGYELLAGEAPFKATSPAETMAAQLTRVPEPISGRRPDVPPMLASLLSRCLAKNPAERPQTASEIASLLDAMDISSGGTMPVRPLRRSRVGLFAGAAIVLVGASLFAWRLGAFGRAAAPVASPARDSAPVLAKPPELTHDDSVAIARAIAQKVQERRALAAKSDSAKRAQPPAAAPTPKAAVNTTVEFARMADSIRQEIQKAVLDSVAHERGAPRFGDTKAFMPNIAALESLAIRGRRSDEPGAGRGRSRNPGTDTFFYRNRPTATDSFAFRNRSSSAASLSEEAFAERAANLGPPRRLFLSTPAIGSRTGALIAPVVDSLADSLRRAIARVGRYRIVDAESTKAELQHTRSFNTIAQEMQVDLFVALYVSVMPDTSILWNVTTRDLSAHSAYQLRAVSAKAARTAYLAPADSLVAAIVKSLNEMDRAPRKRQPPPGGPPEQLR